MSIGWLRRIRKYPTRFRHLNHSQMVTNEDVRYENGKIIVTPPVATALAQVETQNPDLIEIKVTNKATEPTLVTMTVVMASAGTKQFQFNIVPSDTKPGIASKAAAAVNPDPDITADSTGAILSMVPQGSDTFVSVSVTAAAA